MKLTHTVYPISYVNDEGIQRNAVWNHMPIGDQYWVGEPIEITVEHPDALGEEYRKAEIAELEKRLESLKGRAA